MLSTVTAAETLFRHDSETRARELATLRSIRDRKEAFATPASHRVAVRPAPAWPRPIGVKIELTASAVVCA